MRWSSLLALVLLPLNGCVVYATAGAELVPARAVTTDLWFGLATQSANGPQQNAFDEPLHTGDKAAVIVHCPDPMWVYLVNVPPTKEPQLLYEGSEAIHGTVRIPGQGWYELTPPSGHELLVMVASRERLDMDGSGGYWLMEQVAAESTRDDLPSVQSAQPPGFNREGYASIGVRGEGLRLRGNGSVSVDPTGRDSVILIVDIDHRPR